jgi:hypothetical protein
MAAIPDKEKTGPASGKCEPAPEATPLPVEAPAAFGGL